MAAGTTLSYILKHKSCTYVKHIAHVAQQLDLPVNDALEPLQV